MLLSRRRILTGLLAAPAVVAADRIMRVKPIIKTYTRLPVFTPETYEEAVIEKLTIEGKPLISWIPYRVHLTDDGIVMKRADREEQEFHMARTGTLFAPAVEWGPTQSALDLRAT